MPSVEAHRNPETLEMHDEKEKHNATRQKHHPGGKGTVFRRMIGRITLGAGAAIEKPNPESPKDVNQESRKKHDFKGPDEPVGSVGSSVRVECAPTVVFKKQEISREVNYQKNAQEQSRKRRDDLLSHR